MKKYLPLLFLLGGCDAVFVDRRSPAEIPTPPELPDLAAIDLSGLDLSGLDLAGADLSSPEQLLAAGTFMGRAGHFGSGDGQLYRRADGVIEVRFGANFNSSGVPSPVAYLTSRADMGSTIDPQADVEVGIPKASGAQSFVVPAGKEVGRRHLFVYCRSFRVEVAKAQLVDR
jgi:hypothetical protein